MKTYWLTPRGIKKRHHGLDISFSSPQVFPPNTPLHIYLLDSSCSQIKQAGINTIHVFLLQGDYCSTPGDLQVVLSQSLRDSQNAQAVQKQLMANLDSAGLSFRGTTPSNGNCFFEAVCDQLLRLDRPHYSPSSLRENVVEFMKQNRSFNVIDTNLLKLYLVKGTRPLLLHAVLKQRLCYVQFVCVCVCV